MSALPLEFVAVCRSCGVPSKGALLLEFAPNWWFVSQGGELGPSGWTCDTCAVRLAVAGDGVR